MANYQAAVSCENYELSFTTSTGSGYITIAFEANDSGFPDKDDVIKGIRDHAATLPGYVSSVLTRRGLFQETL